MSAEQRVPSTGVADRCDVALGIDLGTTAVKVGLFTMEDGRAIALASRPYTLSTPRTGWVELDPEVYFQRTVEGVRDVLSVAPKGSRVVSIGLSSQGQTFVMLDAEGRPVRPAIVWVDTRAEQEARDLTEVLPPEVFEGKTGIPFPNPVDSAPKILWVRRHEPEVFARAAHVLILPSYISYRLTGRPVADSTNARSMGLLGADGQWWPEAVEAVGLSAERLGEVAPPGTRIGPLTRAAADALGLEAGIPVSTGTNDQSAGALSMGNYKPGGLSATMGTAMAVHATLDAQTDPRGSGLLAGRHAFGDHWFVIAYMKTAAIALTWLRDVFMAGESYDALMAEAASVPPGAEGLTCLPHLTGMGTPSFDGSVRGAFLNLGFQHDRRHFIRAVMESVCFGARDSLDHIRALGTAFEHIVVSGGATVSDVWMHMLADCLGITVTVAACSEAACRGGAMLGAMGAGIGDPLSWPVAPDGGPARVFMPDAAVASAYDEAHLRYLEAMYALYPGAREVGP